MKGIERALEDIRAGKIVLVYDFDDRERETDMTVASSSVTPEIVRTMRKDAGGLLCTTTPYGLADAIGLPFLSDIFWDAREKYPVLAKMAPTDIPYDRTKSSFGVTINHRDTYTGIPDRDRALTISEYARTIFSGRPPAEISDELGRKFRAPGHVHLLNTSRHILENRHGHTELVSALMYMAGVAPSATICEMMGDDCGSMAKDKCMEYAERNGLAFVTGDEIVSAWREFKAAHPELDV